MSSDRPVPSPSMRRRQSQPSSYYSLCIQIVVVVVALLLATSGITTRAEAAPAPSSWLLTQRLRDDINGQPFMNYSDAFHSYKNTMAIGSTSYNVGKGQVMILHDDGGGMQIQAILKDADGIVGDAFGSYVHIFEARDLLHIAVTALYKKDDGAVFLYRQKENVPSLWELQEVYYPPDETYVNDFGRNVLYDGYTLLINAERRYVSGHRFVVSTVNWKGTSYWQESDGVSPMAGDPVFVYTLEEQREQGTHLILAKTLSDASYTLDYGVSMGVSEEVLAVGGSYRNTLLYGHGTDGDLVVTGIYLLDGTAEYNFNSVTIKAGGTLTVGRYEEESMSGGKLLMRVKETLVIEAGGAINLTAYGYPGGATPFTGGQPPEKGYGPGGGYPATSTFVGSYTCDYDGSVSGNVPGGTTASTVGRPVNSTKPFAEASGGGGSYGTVGYSGTDVYCGDSGLPGDVYGDEYLTTAYLGSGGGSGFPWQVGSGGRGGNGGGSITIYAQRIINKGTIEANGGHGDDGGFFSGGGGGGSGGSVALYGAYFENDGRVLAQGGHGGLRAIGSGFGEDPDAKGGDGGDGRIMLDFLTTAAAGTVLPTPRSQTTYKGDVLIYKRDINADDAAGKLWTFYSYLPRLSGMMFVGHQIALAGYHLAVASDEGTTIDPIQKVYYFDLTNLHNSDSVLPFRVLEPPQGLVDQKFGWKLMMQEGILVIGAEGTLASKGSVYIYQGDDLLTTTTTFTEERLTNGFNGDYFGNRIHLAFPFLFIQEPFSQDDQPAANSRRSIGNIHYYKWVRSVTGSASHVTCEFSTITVDNVVNCTVLLFSSDGLATGDINELEHLVPAVDFKTIGVYSFQRSFPAAGSYSITIDYYGTPLTPFAMTVTPAVDPLQSTFSCTPNPVISGQEVTCSIVTNTGAGEAIAAREFDVHVYRMEDAELTVNGTRVYTPFGLQYINIPSFHIINSALWDDYPTIAPEVTYVSQSNFQFKYTPWLPGYFAAYVMYKRVALKFPNPSVIEATPAAVDGTNTVLDCPTNVAPNRPFTCVVDLKGVNGYRTGDKSWAAQYVTVGNMYGTVTTINTGTTGVALGDVYRPLYSWWAGEGRIMIVMNMTLTTGGATVTYTAKANNIPITVKATTLVKENLPAVCNRFPELEQYINLFEANMYYDIDTFRYGEWVEARTYRGKDSSWCDEPRI